MSRPPIEKLPLAARKDMRDNWEANRDAIATKVSGLLGEQYTLEVDMSAVYPYADSGYAKDRPGQMTKDYFDGFLYRLEEYLKKYGDDGKNTFNQVVTTKKITFEVDPTKDFYYCGCDVKEGRFRILAKEGYLATNINDACAEILKAIEQAEAAAGGSGLSVGAKGNVKETVDKEWAGLEKQFETLIGTKIILDANLEANYAKLKAGSTSFNDAYLGTVTVDYFKGFASNLESLKFAGDEMMQEGFQDACEKKTIRLEVVDQLQHGYYNDVIFEDGVCKIQAVPGYWWTNVGDVGRDVVDRL